MTAAADSNDDERKDLMQLKHRAPATVVVVAAFLAVPGLVVNFDELPWGVRLGFGVLVLMLAGADALRRSGAIQKNGVTC
jgi:hypothetical protein